VVFSGGDRASSRHMYSQIFVVSSVAGEELYTHLFFENRASTLSSRNPRAWLPAAPCARHFRPRTQQSYPKDSLNYFLTHNLRCMEEDGVLWGGLRLIGPSDRIYWKNESRTNDEDAGCTESRDGDNTGILTIRSPLVTLRAAPLGRSIGAPRKRWQQKWLRIVGGARPTRSKTCICTCTHSKNLRQVIVIHNVNSIYTTFNFHACLI